MPFLSKDPFRECLFANTSCPEDVTVPVKDYDAYQLFPKYRWIYNKLTIAEIQGLTCAPHGVIPTSFPVFSKPIFNLKSMGAGSRILHNYQEYLDNYSPGHMWSELLDGEHISTDLAVLYGKVVWLAHTRGHPMPGGTFDRWDINVEIPCEHERYLIQFVETNLEGYSGMLNAEMIDGRIIEAHLRFSDQWVDLYPVEFLKAVIDLYQWHSWCPSTELRNLVNGYSVVLFGSSGKRYWKKPDKESWEKIREDYPGVSSVTVTFLDETLSKYHSMPPGGFRLACVNGTCLESCLKVRNEVELLINRANK